MTPRRLRRSVVLLTTLVALASATVPASAATVALWHMNEPSGRRMIDASGNGNRFKCTIDAVVPHLREEGYTQDNAYRYDPECKPSHGGSGSPIVLRDGVTVVGVHSTGNDNGEQCTANNPCEVAADGTVAAWNWIQLSTGILPTRLK